jgi:hypothetical protein
LRCIPSSLTIPSFLSPSFHKGKTGREEKREKKKKKKGKEKKIPKKNTVFVWSRVCV